MRGAVTAAVSFALAMPAFGWQPPHGFGSRARRAPVTSLVQQLKDPDWEKRLEAARRLGASRGDERKVAVPALVQALQTDTEAMVRMKAVDSLRQIGEPAKPGVPAVIRALADADRRVQISAIHTLVALQPEGRDGAAEMRRLLVHADPDVRYNAAVGLVRLGVHTEDAVRLIREGMKDPQVTARVTAAALLVLAIGPEGARKEVMPLIEEGLASTSIGAVRAALTALQRLGPSSLPRILAVAKSDRDEQVRLAAIRTLGRMGEAARPAIAGLMQIANEKGGVGPVAARAVRRIEAGGRPEDSSPSPSPPSDRDE